MAALAEESSPRMVAAHALRKAMGCDSLSPTCVADNVSLVATKPIKEVGHGVVQIVVPVFLNSLHFSNVFRETSF